MIPLVAMALAAAPVLRIGHSVGEGREGRLGDDAGDEYVRIWTTEVLDIELGFGARVNDRLSLGVSAFLSPVEMAGTSYGVLAMWAPFEWTRASPLVELRASYSRVLLQCSCLEQDDTAGLLTEGVMLQLRPGVRFGFGERGWGIGIQGELRAAYRTVSRLSRANGFYAGGLIGGIVTLDVPLGRSPAN